MIGSSRSSGAKASKAKKSKEPSKVLKSTATSRQMAENDGDDDDLANTGSSEEEPINLPTGINEN
jgi:hypothetical protein